MKIPAVEFIRFVDSILRAYPDDVFIPPTRDEWKKCNEVLKAAGLSLSAFSGDTMRRALNLARGEFERRLKDEGEDEIIYLRMTRADAWETKQALAFIAMSEGGETVKRVFEDLDDELEGRGK